MLDFEREIEEFSNKIEELKKLSLNEKLDLSEEIHKMEQKLDEMKTNIYKNLSPWEKLSLARLKERPTAVDYIEAIFKPFIEFHGDRYFGDDSSIIGGVGKIDDIPVTVIAQEKGKNTKESIARNFGMTNPEGYRKAYRLMKQAEKFNRPVICIIDTPGAYCGVGAEERGQGEAIAKNLMLMSELRVPVISIIIGEGCSGGALALAVADQVWMLENSVYSLLSPEGFSSILWKDSSKAPEAAEVMKSTADDLKNFGIIDRVIKEPLGGAHKDPDFMTSTLKQAILQELKSLKEINIEKLLNDRYEKFRKIGEYNEPKF